MPINALDLFKLEPLENRKTKETIYRLDTNQSLRKLSFCKGKAQPPLNPLSRTYLSLKRGTINWGWLFNQKSRKKNKNVIEAKKARERLC